MNEEKDLIQIRDKRNANGEPTGTEITLLIPTETTL
jgi:hypothetical protein